VVPNIRDNPAITAAWARGHVRQLEDRYAAGAANLAALEQTIIATALRFGILCRFTAYVAVDRAAVANPEGEVQKITQPVEMPSRWCEDVGSVAGHRLAAPASGRCEDVGAFATDDGERPLVGGRALGLGAYASPGQVALAPLQQGRSESASSFYPTEAAPDEAPRYCAVPARPDWHESAKWGIRATRRFRDTALVSILASVLYGLGLFVRRLVAGLTGVFRKVLGLNRPGTMGRSSRGPESKPGMPPPAAREREEFWK
jgi:hypothetical protein